MSEHVQPPVQHKTIRPVLREFLITISIIVIVVMIASLPLIAIQMRLWRNQPIARSLADSINAEFPGVQCHGNASYQEDVIYISAYTRFAKSKEKDVEKWLRIQKHSQNIKAQIWISFSISVEEPDIIKIVD